MTLFSPVPAFGSLSLQIDAFQHMQHFVQGMQQQAQHAIAAEDQQHKQELHKLMARFVVLSEHCSSSSSDLFFHREYFHKSPLEKHRCELQKVNDGRIPFSF